LACCLIKQHPSGRVALQNVARCVKRILGRVEIGSQ
jgi:hypothetical protein